MSNKFLLESDVDELELIKNEYYSERDNQEEIVFRILTTLDCNADCVYCFEKDRKNEYMDEKRCDDVADYIIHKSESFDKIQLGWFGGEPLLNAKAIQYIFQKVNEAYPDKEIRCEITTNGSLFNNDLINYAQGWNLYSIQITLDGTEANHNLVKRYKDVQNGFLVTLMNIHKLIEANLPVTIRINYNEDNFLDILDLIDQLHETFGNKIHIYCSPIYTIEEGVQEKKMPSYLESILLRKLYDYNYYDLDYLIKRRYTSCGFATYPNHFIIYPNGTICKCSEAMVRPDTSIIGNIYGDLDSQKIEQWGSFVNDPRCMHCRYLPLCIGGCKLTRQKMNSMSCFRFKSQVINVLNEIIHKKLQTL